MFFKIDVFKNFQNSREKLMCQSLILNIVAGLRSETLLKK